MKNTMNQTIFNLGAALVLLMSTACASTGTSSSGAASRVTAPTHQLSEKQIEKQHEALTQNVSELQALARRDVQRGFHKVALMKYNALSVVLVQDVELLTELQTRQGSLKDRMRVQERINSVRAQLKQVQKTQRLLNFYAKG